MDDFLSTAHPYFQSGPGRWEDNIFYDSYKCKHAACRIQIINFNLSPSLKITDKEVCKIKLRSASSAVCKRKGKERL